MDPAAAAMFLELTMNRRQTLFLAFLGFFFSADSEALEKNARLIDVDREENAWNLGCTFRMSYYNICTGWVWAWSGWEPGNQFGMSLGPLYEACDNHFFYYSYVFALDLAPPGYGYTGTLALYNSNSSACTVGEPLSVRPFLADEFVVPVEWLGSAHPYQYAAIVMTVGPTPGNPMSLLTDRPAAGPTGPNACGTCYPANRVGHSFFYEGLGGTLCPSSPFNDGVCDAELLWDTYAIGFSLDSTVNVEGASWGKIKALYR